MAGAPHQLVQEVARFFARHPAPHGRRLMLAVSGGADSVALLHALAELRPRIGCELHIAHLNHGLRGAEADRDESFVRELSAALDIPLEVGRSTALRGASNLEERARQARYAFLEEAADRAGANHIALAHHAGDQAETVLLRLIRGSGLTGLGAMAEVGPGKLIRPLLSVEPNLIRDYLTEIGARFVEDSSNTSLTPDRNRVRHLVMPLLEREFVPGLTQRLNALAAELRATQELLASQTVAFLAAAVDAQGGLEIERLRELHPGLLNAALRSFVSSRIGSLRRFDRGHIEAIRQLCINSAPNAQIDLPGGWRACRQYGKLRLDYASRVESEAPGYELALRTDEATWVEAAGVTFHYALLARDAAAMPASQQEAVFDAQAVAPGLRVRSFRPGDRIAPLGMDGSRKVKDVFIGGRIPRQQRTHMPIVALGDQIVWLPGLVRSNIAMVGAQTTAVVRVRAVGIAPNLNCVLASK